MANYWLIYYLSDGGCGHLCGLCGNGGIVDTRRSAKSPQGVKSGIKTFCICPNGQALRAASK